MQNTLVLVRKHGFHTPFMGVLSSLYFTFENLRKAWHESMGKARPCSNFLDSSWESVKSTVSQHGQSLTVLPPSSRFGKRHITQHTHALGVLRSWEDLSSLWVSFLKVDHYQLSSALHLFFLSSFSSQKKKNVGSLGISPLNYQSLWPSQGLRGSSECLLGFLLWILVKLGVVINIFSIPFFFIAFLVHPCGLARWILCADIWGRRSQLKHGCVFPEAWLCLRFPLVRPFLRALTCSLVQHDFGLFVLTTILV